MKLVYLGTSGAMPTIERGLSCTVLDLGKHYIMVDCGDGTCRQYLKSYLKWNKPMTLLITHLHSDHIMGILGLFQSMDLMGRTEPVKVYGPKGIKAFILNLHRGHAVQFAFDFDVVEIEAGDSITHKHFSVSTCRGKHQVPIIAYRVVLPDRDGALDIEKCHTLGVPDGELLGKLKRGEDVKLFETVPDKYTVTIKSKDVVGEKRKGLQIGFSGDTRPTEDLETFFKDCDYLTFESTFRTDELDLALKSKHSTASETGELAGKAGVKTLLLNHFSARHENTEGFYKDASKFHKHVIVTRDFLEIELK
jgi:ribonuclease Z